MNKKQKNVFIYILIGGVLLFFLTKKSSTPTVTNTSTSNAGLSSLAGTLGNALTNLFNSSGNSTSLNQSASDYQQQSELLGSLQADSAFANWNPF